MYKFFLLFLFSIITGITFSQTEKVVTVKGFAPGYVGKSIAILEIEDYLSMKEASIATATVQADSTFSVSFFVKETQKIVIRPDKNKSFMYVQPGGIYDIYLPDKDQYEVYRPNGNSIEVTFFGLDSTDINYKILEFQRWSDDFLSQYYHLKNIKPLEFAEKLDEFKLNVEKYYNMDDTLVIKEPGFDPFFNTFVRFSMAGYDNVQFAVERNRYEKHDFYIKNAPVSYRNDAYMTYFNTFYEKMIPRLSMETNNRVYLGVLKSSPTLVMRALGGEYTLINMRIREMVMIKALSEQFYSNDFPQTNILTILDSVSKKSLFAANSVIAENMKERLTELVQGGKAPDFVLSNGSDDMKTIGNYRKKHVYLHFYDPASKKNQIEVEPLIRIYETYKEDVFFITIYPEGNYSDEDQAILKTIPWEKFNTNISNPIWKNYKIETFPSYVLIDGYGYVVGAPALGPMPDGQYQTIDKTLFYIQKTNAELRGEDR